jgi:hypothetical protein
VLARLTSSAVPSDSSRANSVTRLIVDPYVLAAVGAAALMALLIGFRSTSFAAISIAAFLAGWASAWSP